MLITFFISFGLYLITLCPTVYVGDSGEFTTAARILGITHPPGYPLYVLFGKIFSTLFPFGNIGYRINLMSAFFGALTCGMVYLISKRLINNNINEFQKENTKTSSTVFTIAIISALFLSFSKTFWSQAVVAEIYTINAFFITLLIYISITKYKNLYLFSFISGLGIAGHYITGLLFPVFLILYWKELFHKKNLPERFFLYTIFFLLGLSVLIFMPIRSSANPFMDWGNTRIFEKFIDQIRRVQYKTFEFGQTVNLQTKFSFIKYFFKLAGEQFTYYIIPLILLVTNSIVMLLILKFQFNPQQASVVEVYFLPSYSIMALWLGFGLLFIAKYLKPYFFIPLLILPLIMHFKYNSKRNNYIAYDYSSNILKSLPENSHYFSSGDNQMFLLSYQQWCLKRRLDASFYTDTGLLFKNIFGNDFFQLTKEEKQNRRALVENELLLQSRPICFSLGCSFSNLKNLKSEITGIVFRAKPLPADFDLWNFYVIRDIDNKNYLDEYLLRDVSAQYHYFLAEKYYKFKNIKNMQLEFDAAADVGGDVEWVYNNIGISLKEKGLEEEAIIKFKKGIETNPYDDSAKINLAFIYLNKGYEKYQIQKYENQ